MSDQAKIRPVYIDGPLVGGDWPLAADRETEGVTAIESTGEGDFVTQVHYRIFRVVAFGRTLSVGTCRSQTGAEIDAALFARLLTPEAQRSILGA